MTQEELEKYYKNLYKIRKEIKQIEKQIAINPTEQLLEQQESLHKHLQYWLKKINFLEKMYEFSDN